MISYDKSQCETLEAQLDEMCNLLLDDFETNLQQLIRKKDIFAVVEGQSEQNAQNLFNLEVFDSHVQMKDVTEDFTKRISRLMEEMSLISRHKASLKLLHSAYDADRVLPSIEPLAEVCTRKYAALVFVINERCTPVVMEKNLSYLIL
jgi:maltodextrin utilization protein YvdJ